MIDTSAIATVTVAIQYLLRGALARSPLPGSPIPVTTAHPATVAHTAGSHGAGVNVHLLRLNPAPVASARPARAGGTPPRPDIALELHYLVHPYGGSEILQQCLLARAALVLASTPILTEGVVDAALRHADPDDRELIEEPRSAHPSEPVRIAAESASLEDLRAIWGMLGTRSVPSLAYRADIVLSLGSDP